MSAPILFSLRESRELSRDAWTRFVEACRRAGKTPAAVLVDLIATYTQGTDRRDEANADRL